MEKIKRWVGRMRQRYQRLDPYWIEVRRQREKEKQSRRRRRNREVEYPVIHPGGNVYQELESWATFQYWEGDEDGKRCLQLLEVVQRYNVFQVYVPALPESYRLRIPIGLCNLMRIADAWIRPSEDWSPGQEGDDVSFSSLLRHLLAEREVPLFMDYVWLMEDDDEVKQYREWFLAIARGQNLRRVVDLPVRMTPKMYQAFMNAPENLTIPQAIRWGQVVGGGGSHAAALELVFSRLGTRFENEEFWETVIRYFAEHPEIAPAEYIPIIDYIEHSRFVDRGWADVDGKMVELGPARPRMSMKGRKLEKLRRDVRLWHRELAVGDDDPYCDWFGPFGSIEEARWPSCGIPGFEIVDNEYDAEVVYTTRELLSVDDLRYEGKIMDSCVSSYFRLCAKGESAIFSLRRKGADGAELPWVTIEVDPGLNRIVQAKGKGNAAVSPEQHRILVQWARKSDVGLGRFAYGVGGDW